MGAIEEYSHHLDYVLPIEVSSCIGSGAAMSTHERERSQPLGTFYADSGVYASCPTS